ncbi:hypothetical protein Xinn_04171 [Xenorhabdus innexi]|uniref:Uncharacterized protein n=1 Tax=Xenorhabdus innexi TaxID=290109 RepID=A0A2G0MI02_9GAMM|nr:hypothetical protein Xinn_04171 [Xenorhabdus innexi]
MRGINKQNRLMLTTFRFQRVVALNKLVLFIRVEFMRCSHRLFITESLTMEPFCHPGYRESHLPASPDIVNNLRGGVHQIGRQIFNEVCRLFGR